MKAQAQTESLINQQPQLKLCENQSSNWLFWQRLLSALGQFTPAKKKLYYQLRTMAQRIARAVRDQLVGPVALLLSVAANKRIFIGLGLMGVVSPLASCLYMVFDRGVYDAGWYYVNYFHLFLVLGPSLFILSCMLGAWFLFPHGSKRAYGLVVPTGFTVGKIMWLIQCTSNDDFYSIVPFSFILIGALISVFLFVASDWLTHNAFHREAAFARREGTLYNGVDHIDGDQFKGLFKQYFEEKKAFQKQF